jgi:hypothetical protein
MIILKTELNGQPFEITVDDGLTLEFSAGKLRVAKSASLPLASWNGYPLYQQQHNVGVNPFNLGTHSLATAIQG